MNKKSDTSITIRMNKDVKQEAQMLFAQLGLDMTTAINIFLRKSISVQGFPFDVRLDVPNATTVAAIEEAKRMLRDPKTDFYDNVDDLITDLRKDALPGNNDNTVQA